MKRYGLGILGTSEIAYRRFLPALEKFEGFKYVGIASREMTKTQKFKDEFKGMGYGSYDELLNDESINVVYIPLPPSLHFQWAEKALQKGKHILLEKPFTTSIEDTKGLIDIAKKEGLSLHENYMFQYHSQIGQISEMVRHGEVGDVRLYRIAFGFPKRSGNDFRYSKSMGGGALFDCGGYTVKLASMLLGETAKIITSKLNYVTDYDVDLYGSATMVNDDGVTAQISFGMDNSYKCELEIWGSNGTLYTNRILTAPVGFEPTVTVKVGNEKKDVVLNSDDSFLKSIKHFYECIENDEVREENYKNILKQSELVRELRGEFG